MPIYGARPRTIEFKCKNCGKHDYGFIGQKYCHGRKCLKKEYIKSCKKCSSEFTATHHHKLFCSPKCRQVAIDTKSPWKGEPAFFLGNKEVNTYMIMSEKNSIINGSFMRNTGFFVNHPDPKMFKATHILSNNYNMKELHKDDLMYFHYKGNNRYKSYMWHFNLPASLQANDCILYIDA